MSVGSGKKPLHIAKSMKELNQHANTPTDKKNPRILVKSTQLLLKHASESLLDGDEEKAYVLYMRFFNVVTCIKKSKEYKDDKKYYDGLIGEKNCKLAIEKAEGLCETLKMRYDELEALALSKRLDSIGAEVSDQVKDTLETADKTKIVAPLAAVTESPDTSVKALETLLMDVSAPAGWVRATKLYEWFCDSSLSVLFLDTRKNELFSDSHVVKMDHVVNVPDVHPGSTAKNIEVKLTGRDLSCWKKRSSYDVIVIADLETDDKNFNEKNSTLASVKAALVEWDQECKPKNDPLFLFGGYKDWAFTYPMFVNKPLSTVDNSTNKINSYSGYNDEALLLTLNSINYDIALSFLNAPSNPPIAETPENGEGNTTSLPTEANYTSSRVVPLVDRTKKPRAQPPELDSKGNEANISTIMTNRNFIPTVNRGLKPPSQPQLPVQQLPAQQLTTLKSEPKTQVPVMPGSHSSSSDEDLISTPALRTGNKNIEDHKIAQTSLTTTKLEQKVDEVESAGDKFVKKLFASDRFIDSDSDDDDGGFGRMKKLRDDIRELESNKRLLEKEMEELERKKAENDRKLELDSAETTLARQRAKEVRELADLMRKKKKVSEELEDLIKLKQKQEAVIVNGNGIKSRRSPSSSPHGSIKSTIQNGHGSIKSTIQNGPKMPEVILKAKNQTPSISPTVQENQPTPMSSQSASPAHKKPPQHVPLPSISKPAVQSGSVSNSSQDQQNQYIVHLKDEGSVDTESKSNLKRYHSSPNIAKILEDSAKQPQAFTPDPAGAPRTPSQVVIQQQPKTVQGYIVQPPRVDRSVKPMNPIKNLLEAKVRNFQPLWGNTLPGLTGLRNLGNTCYMNSIIQCLSNCYVFCRYFISDHYGKDLNWTNRDGQGGEVAVEFAILVKHLWSGQYKSISPYDFRVVVSRLGAMFASSQHQDAQELLDFLMNGLNEDLNRVKTKPQLQPQDNSKLDDEIASVKAWRESLLIDNSITVDLFRGQYKSRVMCSYCETKSTVFEPFMSLTLQIPENQSKCSLSDCLLHFSNEEKMTGDCKWLCPQCKQKREATKRIVVWRLPQILVVHLKRFHYQGIWRNKISTNVSFPVTGLDMARYLSGPRNIDANYNTVYNLFAVCNHYGTLDGGHYTAFCKNPSINNWFKFDDSDVSEISTSSIQSSAAYLLFYAKV